MSSSFIHVVAGAGLALLLKAEEYSLVWIRHIYCLSIHLPPCGLLPPFGTRGAGSVIRATERGALQRCDIIRRSPGRSNVESLNLLKPAVCLVSKGGPRPLFPSRASIPHGSPSSLGTPGPSAHYLRTTLYDGKATVMGAFS